MQCNLNAKIINYNAGRILPVNLFTWSVPTHKTQTYKDLVWNHAQRWSTVQAIIL